MVHKKEKEQPPCDLMCWKVIHGWRLESCLVTAFHVHSHLWRSSCLSRVSSLEGVLTVSPFIASCGSFFPMVCNSFTVGGYLQISFCKIIPNCLEIINLQHRNFITDKSLFPLESRFGANVLTDNGHSSTVGEHLFSRL